MDQVIHGVNKKTKSFSFSNYSLTTQIVIINFSTAIFALIALFFFNFVILNSNKNLNNQKELAINKLNEKYSDEEINSIFKKEPKEIMKATKFAAFYCEKK